MSTCYVHPQVTQNQPPIDHRWTLPSLQKLKRFRRFERIEIDNLKNQIILETERNINSFMTKVPIIYKPFH